MQADSIAGILLVLQYRSGGFAAWVATFMCLWIQTKGLSENDVLSIPIIPMGSDIQLSPLCPYFLRQFGKERWWFSRRWPRWPCSRGTKGFNMLNSLIKVSSTRAWNEAFCWFPWRRFLGDVFSVFFFFNLVKYMGCLVKIMVFFETKLGCFAGGWWHLGRD